MHCPPSSQDMAHVISKICSFLIQDYCANTQVFVLVLGQPCFLSSQTPNTGGLASRYSQLGFDLDTFLSISLQHRQSQKGAIHQMLSSVCSLIILSPHYPTV